MHFIFRLYINYKRNDMTSSSRTVRRTLYIQRPGVRLGIAAGRWEIKFKDQLLEQIPASLVSQICIMENVQVTSAAMVWCAENGIPMHVLSKHGKHISVSYDTGGMIVATRRRQYELQEKPVRMELAKTIVSNKIGNQTVFLAQTLRNHPEMQINSSTIPQLHALQAKCKTATAIKPLLGIEGLAAKTYFSAWGQCILNKEFTFPGRKKRPASDPVNAMLNFGYSMLLAQVEGALQVRGVDAAIGVVHNLRNGSSLACDFIEQFRTGIVDSLVLKAVNRSQFCPDDFEVRDSECRLKDEPRKRFIQLFEVKMQSERQHPLTKKPVSWKEILDIQALQYKRFLYEKIDKFYPFRLS